MRFATLVILALLVGCDGSDLEGPDYARGGVKGKPVEIVLDSITVLPPDTTVAPGEAFKLEVLYWLNGDPFPRIRCPDGLVYPYLEGGTSCPLDL